MSDNQDLRNTVASDDEIIKEIHRWTNRMATKASHVYAPKGWSGQLSGNIEAQRPYRQGNKFIGIVATEAIHNGESYAKEQHDKPRLHVSAQPLTESFWQYGGNEGTREQRYWRGLWSFRQSGQGKRYATEFFTKARADYEDDMENALMAMFLK